MNRIWAVLLVALLLPMEASAVRNSLAAGQIHTYSWGGGSSDELEFGACPDDLFTVTVTLRLLNPSPVDQVALLVDRASPKPLGVANAATPVTSALVQLGGCDRSFTASVVGLVVLGTTEYQLTFS